MNWWEVQIQRGWQGPKGKPRGLPEAEFPLLPGVRYQVSLSPGKSHLLFPGQDYAYCGITLAPDVGWLIDSGYDAFYWVVADPDSTHWCKDCSTYKAKWDLVGKNRTLPEDSPIPAQEWAETVGVEAQSRALKLDRMATTIAGWFGGGAEVVDE